MAVAKRATPLTRSEVMSRVRSKGSRPEMLVRRTVHQMGYRYRLHRADLPGSPDLVFPSRRKVIFVHGCFWHRHACKLGDRTPKTRQDFWETKLGRNAERDAQAQDDLARLGWEVLVLWECGLANGANLRAQIGDFLGPVRGVTAPSRFVPMGGDSRATQ